MPVQAVNRAAHRETVARTLWLAAAIVAAWLAFWNALSGEFVWDDKLQIARNPYLADAQHYARALTTDVWSFRAEEGSPAGNYWRPLFVTWLIANFRAFGTQPAGWHVTSLLLHCGVLVAATGVLARLGVVALPAGLVLLLFAVHPVHTESVAWIAGATDPLAALFLLASYYAFLRQRAAGSPAWRWAAWALYAAATLAKEIALLFPLLVAFTEWNLAPAAPNDASRSRARRALAAALPFLIIAALYFVARGLTLGVVARAAPWAPDAVSIALTIPALIAFYLRQSLFPAVLSPIYPLRALDTGQLLTADFLVPLAITVGVVAVAAYLWRRDAIYRIGMAWFAIPLLPALNIASFFPDHLVHDRYLYLPLFGILLVAVHCAWRIAARLSGGRAAIQASLVLVPSLAAAVLLALATISYNRVWLGEQALWRRGSEVDPRSTFALSQLGHELLRRGQPQEAKPVLLRAMEIDPTVTSVLIDLGEIAQRERRFGDAEALYRRVLGSFPTHAVAVDQLGNTLLQQGKLAEMRELFRSARNAAPQRRVKYTLYIAVLTQQLGDPDGALRELESVRDLLAAETDPNQLRAYFQLGEWYQAAGRYAEAKDAYQAYLERTRGLAGPEVLRYRGAAQQRLGVLPR